MTIMPSDLPVNATGLVEDFIDTVAEAYPLFGEVQKLARVGVRVAFEVAPSTIAATITVDSSATGFLPALLAEIDNARQSALPDGQLLVTGSMFVGNVKLRVLIPNQWVTADELAVLLGTGSTDPGALL